jgi:hypothetical protein
MAMNNKILIIICRFNKTKQKKGNLARGMGSGNDGGDGDGGDGDGGDCDMGNEDKSLNNSI